MNSQIALLSFVAVLQVVTLLLFLRNRKQHPMEGVTQSQQEKALRSLFNVQEKLTAMNWNVDMILEGKKSGFGSPNLAQKEFLHQVREDASQATTMLNTALKDLDCSPTSATFQGTKKH